MLSKVLVTRENEMAIKRMPLFANCAEISGSPQRLSPRRFQFLFLFHEA